MPIAAGPALLISGILGAGASVASGVLGSKASSSAAKAQEDATKYAADLQKQSSDAALQFQKDTTAQQRADIAPWLATGTTALGQLGSLTAPGGQLTQPFNFNGADFKGDPGFQFRIAEGQKALEHAASARGNLLGGATQKALTRYSQDYASNEYDRAYNRAFNTFNVNNSNLFNRLSSLAGTGQQATALLGQEGSQAAANVGNNLLTTGTNLANLATQGGNARASGYIGPANAWAGALGGLTNTATNLAAFNAFRPQLPPGFGQSPAYANNNLGDYNGAGPGLPPALTPSQFTYNDLNL